MYILHTTYYTLHTTYKLHLNIFLPLTIMKDISKALANFTFNLHIGIKYNTTTYNKTLSTVETLCLLILMIYAIPTITQIAAAALIAYVLIMRVL